MIYVTVSTHGLPIVVEVFSTEAIANQYALAYKMKCGRTLAVRPREIDVVDITVLQK